jgi:hypothetical protein
LGRRSGSRLYGSGWRRLRSGGLGRRILRESQLSAQRQSARRSERRR